MYLLLMNCENTKVRNHCYLHYCCQIHLVVRSLCNLSLCIDCKRVNN